MATPVFTAQTDVPVEVTLPLMGSGQPITATGITYSVADEMGIVIATGIVVTPPAVGSPTVMFTVPSSYHVLGALVVNPATGSIPFNAIRSLRTITTTITYSGGVDTDVQNYIIRSAQPLVRMVNSFLTMPETVLARYEMVNMDGWDASTDDQRIAALSEAWKAMTALRFRFPIGVTSQSRIMDFFGISVDNVFGRIFMVIADISFYTDTDFQNWPLLFQQALQRAQMAQADNLLRGDPIGDKRNSGILSETTGESSMTFRKVPEVVMPVCPAALQQLRGYVTNTVLVARG